uniref:Uncharacterized protein n=1 Tax=Anguilla anguilla TaxID=7936 RepID=A0A0E9RZN6_ANGAN
MLSTASHSQHNIQHR